MSPTTVLSLIRIESYEKDIVIQSNHVFTFSLIETIPVFPFISWHGLASHLVFEVTVSDFHYLSLPSPLF